MTIVNLQKPVTGENLVEACLKAAKEIGYKAKLKYEFRKEYSLGSIHEEDRYIETNINISWGPIASFRIKGIDKKRFNEFFCVWSGVSLGYTAREKNIKNYLSLVSKYLS